MDTDKSTNTDIAAKPCVVDHCIDVRKEMGAYSLGLLRNTEWHEDPKKMFIALARYKFVAKMLEGKNQVAEIGCGDGFASTLVSQAVAHLLLTDINNILISEIKNNPARDNVTAQYHDIIEAPLTVKYDAIYSLDVMEHFDPQIEHRYLENICSSLNKNGVLMIGMPSLESQLYATEVSKLGHVNCKTGSDLKNTMLNYFDNVFIFSMNDEVVHTGFTKMAHYLFALCCNLK